MQVLESNTFRVTASIGDLDIIASGTVHVNDKNPLVIKLDDLEMKFKFSVDSANSASAIGREVSGNTLIWNLVNFKNAYGEGLVEPVELGSAYKRAFYASFWIWTPVPNSDVRIVNYVMYLGRQVNE